MFLLSYHVDYWDRATWKDGYSNSAYSDRQRVYAWKLGKVNYAPQLIVDGVTEAIASDEPLVRRLLTLGLSKVRTTKVTFSIHYDKNLRMVIDAVVTPVNTSQIVQVAVVERGIVLTPTGGENAGAVLKFENVVRTLATGSVSNPTDTVTLELPRDLRADLASVVVFVQDSKTMAIVAAEMKPLR